MFAQAHIDDFSNVIGMRTALIPGSGKTNSVLEVIRDKPDYSFLLDRNHVDGFRKYVNEVNILTLLVCNIID